MINTMDEKKDDITNQLKKNISTDEAYEYTRKKLTSVLNDIILKTNTEEILKKENSNILHYRDIMLDEIDRILKENKISLDESITIRGAKKYKYYKERLRLILNRLKSRLDEHNEFEYEDLDGYSNLINSYIYNVGLDYELDLITFDLDS